MNQIKSPDAFRTISEAAEELRVPQHVLRFWETRFSQIKPMKRAGGRRYYRPEDIDLLKGIRVLLYEEGYTIRGVLRIFKEEGAGFINGVGRGEIKPRKGDAMFETAPAPGTARVAPRRGAAKATPTPGSAPRAPHIMEPVRTTYRLTEGQNESLKSALKDLTDARKLLDVVGR
jgi:DNA-binding transcriptional MerR regulator